MLDKIDRKLLALLQEDCTLSLQALADAVNLTTTPCWKRLKRLVLSVRERSDADGGSARLLADGGGV